MEEAGGEYSWDVGRQNLRPQWLGSSTAEGTKEERKIGEERTVPKRHLEI